jgi:hypothetical protein
MDMIFKKYSLFILVISREGTSMKLQTEVAVEEGSHKKAGPKYSKIFFIFLTTYTFDDLVSFLTSKLRISRFFFQLTLSTYPRNI